VKWRSVAFWLIIDFDMKLDVNGKDEIAKAPMITKIVVIGIVLYNPMKSVHFFLPVIYSNETVEINSSVLYIM
jgi:hypothetical protein